MKTKKTKTIGEKMTAVIREAGRGGITDAYWGTGVEYKRGDHRGAYHFWDYCPKYNGMRTTRHRWFAAWEINSCETLEALERLIQPREDTSPGDPLNYAPHSSARCDFKKSILSELGVDDD